jgi:hypothetical protein
MKNTPDITTAKLGRTFRVTVFGRGTFESRDRRLVRRYVRLVERFGFAAAAASKMTFR